MPNAFNQLIDWQACSAEEQQALLNRPALNDDNQISQAVSAILQQVKQDGDAALQA